MNLFRNLDLVMTALDNVLFMNGELFALTNLSLSGACWRSNLIMISSNIS